LSAAKAAFTALSLSEKYRWLLWCYEHLPFFAAISEGFYGLVARRRVFFSRFA
jgi:hypothetical protein